MTNAGQNKQNRLFSPSTCSYQESKEHNYICERVFGACRQEEVLHPNHRIPVVPQSRAAPPNVRVQVATIIKGDPARIRFDVSALVGVISSK